MCSRNKSLFLASISVTRSRFLFRWSANTTQQQHQHKNDCKQINRTCRRVNRTAKWAGCVLWGCMHSNAPPNTVSCYVVALRLSFLREALLIASLLQFNQTDLLLSDCSDCSIAHRLLLTRQTRRVIIMLLFHTRKTRSALVHTLPTNKQKCKDSSYSSSRWCSSLLMKRVPHWRQRQTYRQSSKPTKFKDLTCCKCKDNPYTMFTNWQTRW